MPICTKCNRTFQCTNKCQLNAEKCTCFACDYLSRIKLDKDRKETLGYEYWLEGCFTKDQIDTIEVALKL